MYGIRGEIKKNFGFTWKEMNEVIPWPIIQRMMIDASNYEYDTNESKTPSTSQSNKVSYQTDEDIINYMLNQQNKNL